MLCRRQSGRDPAPVHLERTHTIEVGEVLDRWYQVESKPEWPRADYFKVQGEDGRDYLLEHDLESDEWWLGKSW